MTCLLKDWHHGGIFPVLWKDTLFNGSLEIRESDGAISFDISFKSLPEIWSGPLDLCGSMLERSCSTPSTEMLRLLNSEENLASAIVGKLLSSLVKTELKYLFNSSAFAKLLVTASLLTSKVGIPLQSFR